MDGLSGAASVIAVIDISAKITMACYQYYKAVKDAKHDIERVQRKVGDITHILEKLKLLYSQDKKRLFTTHGLSDSLEQCLRDMENMRTKLGPGKTRKTMSQICYSESSERKLLLHKLMCIILSAVMIALCRAIRVVCLHDVSMIAIGVEGADQDKEEPSHHHVAPGMSLPHEPSQDRLPCAEMAVYEQASG
jgi:hypothetical protein